MEEKEDGERADVQIPKWRTRNGRFSSPACWWSPPMVDWIPKKHPVTVGWNTPWLAKSSFFLVRSLILDLSHSNLGFRFSESFTQKILGVSPVSPDVSQRPGSVFPTAQELCVFDLTVAAVPAAGVAADLGHLERHQRQPPMAETKQTAFPGWKNYDIYGKRWHLSTQKMVKIRGFPDIFTLQLGKKNLLGLRKTNHVTYPTSHWGITIIPFLDDGKIYRKTLYLMVKTCKNPWVSCKFSLKPIQWNLGWFIIWVFLVGGLANLTTTVKLG